MVGWYVEVEGTGPLGPPTDQVSQGLATGQLRQDVLVCRVGGDTWHPLRAFPEFGSRGNPPPPARARVLREGETAARLRHPHVVDITDVGEAEGVPFLVMELLEGEALSALVAALELRQRARRSPRRPHPEFPPLRQTI